MNRYFTPIIRMLFPERSPEKGLAKDQECQRKHPRVSHSLRVLFPQLPHYQGMTTDVSVEGIRVLTSGPLEAGEVLDLEVDIGVFPINLKGKVRWCTQLPDERYQVGFCLKQSRSNNLQAVANLVNQELAAGDSPATPS
jgi:PilZ domain